MLDFNDFLLVVQNFVYIYLCPYTKVEESFNTQSFYDFIHTKDLESFDHIDFGGVVPRSFFGSSFISTLAFPFIKLFNLKGDYELMFIRSTLGLCAIVSNSIFRKSLKREYGNGVSRLYALFFFVQFHFMFYISRPLPNTFALILVIQAFYFFMEDSSFRSFLFLSVAMTIFRCDILVFLCSFGLCQFLFSKPNGESTFKKIIVHRLKVTALSIFATVIGSASGVIFSVTFDSFYWRRFLWPEGEVLYYNTFLNKSSNWGKMPFYWYFAVAIPKSLLGVVPFIFYGGILGLIRNQKIRILFSSTLLFIFLYSFLPHKELRFIFYSLPILNLTASFGIVHLNKVIKMYCSWMRLFNLLIYVVLLSSFFSTFIFLMASVKNYYGADSLNNFHKMDLHLDQQEEVKIHIDSSVTMNGVSLFLYDNYNCSNCVYRKDEGDEIDWRQFDYLLSEKENLEINGFELFAKQYGFSHLNIKNMENIKNPLGALVESPKIMMYRKISEEKDSIESEYRKPIFSHVEDKILNYGEKEIGNLRVPLMKWYQRWEKCIINMIVYDAPSVQYKFSKNGFILVSEYFRAHLRFYGKVNVKKSYVKIRNDKIVVVVVKSRRSNWPRLLKDKTTPDHLKIDWDEWDDEFNVEIQDKEEEMEIDPEAHGYAYDTTESFFKKYKEKVKPEERDKERAKKLQEKYANYKEDLSPYQKFLEIRRGYLAKKRRKEYGYTSEEIGEKNERKRKKVEKKKEEVVSATRENFHESKKVTDNFFELLGVSEQKQIEIYNILYGGELLTPQRVSMVGSLLISLFFVTSYIGIIRNCYVKKRNKMK